MLEFDLRYAWRDFSAHYVAQLAPGMTTVLGGSGEGKSTLLHLLGGYWRGQGRVRFNGRDVGCLPPHERPMTMLFQSDNLLPQLTVWQNVAVGLTPSMKLNPEQRERVQWALEQTQLQAKQQVLPQVLSGGQAQRVAIARVLVRRQPILLLDEPFGALDPNLRQEMLRLVLEITQRLGLTTLLVSHWPQEALTLGGHALLIEQGAVRAQDSVEVLRQTPPPSAWVNYWGSAKRVNHASSADQDVA